MFGQLGCLGRVVFAELREMPDLVLRGEICKDFGLSLKCGGNSLNFDLKL